MASHRPKKSRAKVKAVRRPPEDFGERCLHMNCQQWLEKSGIWSRLLIFHVPNERRGGWGAIKHFQRMGVRPGVADYLAFPSRRGVAIEIKDKEGEQSDGQEKFEAEWKAAGNVYVVVRSLEEFQGVVNACILFV